MGHETDQRSLSRPGKRRAASVARGDTEAGLKRRVRELERQVEDPRALLDLLPVGVGITREPGCKSSRHSRCLRAWFGVDEADASAALPPVRSLVDEAELPAGAPGAGPIFTVALPRSGADT